MTTGKSVFVSLLTLCFSSPLCAGDVYYFRVYLKDKGPSVYSLEKPETFLSSGAIERRQKQNREIDLTDLPVSPLYTDTLESLGAQVVTQSKWLSTVVLSSPDSLFAERAQRLPMVDSVKRVWKGAEGEKGDAPAPDGKDTTRLSPGEAGVSSFYGYARTQIEMLNGVKLHQAGFTGEGIRVAVIDAGFLHADRITAFDSLRIAGCRNFVSPGESVFDDDEHGTKVLSCMAACLPGVMAGTAPRALYWLLKTEDGRSEYPVEEDYWVAAVEFADSAGVEVISTSLGYFRFDDPEANYAPEALDGKTSPASRAAALAAAKGMLVFCSAGNEGKSDWGKITFPSDADGILTVGAVTAGGEKSDFSSVGFTADGRVKPDVAAMGTGCCVIDGGGHIRYVNGTSFATPILAGLGVCLRQALPALSNTEIIHLIRQSSGQYKRPDAGKGYGIPDVYKAYKKGLKYDK
jgi:subtilisin family serine protease